MKIWGQVRGGRLARFWLGLLLFGFMFSSTPTLALEGIGVSPTSREITLDPGKADSGQITVINDGNTDVTYKVNVSDYQVIGEVYKGTFNSSGAQANISPVSWFTLPQGNFVVKAGQNAKVSYTITAPASATPGGHYAAVFVETVPPAANGSTVIRRVQKIGSLFYIAVTGDMVTAGNIKSLTTPFLQLEPPIEAALRVKNTGNVHFVVESQAYLTNLFGHKETPISLRGEVLPGTTRQFPLRLTSSSTIGIYKVTTEVKFLDKSETLSAWTLLIPPITLAVIGSTLVILVLVGAYGMGRRLRREK